MSKEKNGRIFHSGMCFPIDSRPLIKNSNHFLCWPWTNFSLPAILTGEIALAGYIKYYGAQAGLVAAVLVRLGAAYHKTDQHDTARHCLHRADSIYRLIPGAHSSFYRHEFRPVFNKIVQWSPVPSSCICVLFLVLPLKPIYMWSQRWEPASISVG